MSVRPTANCSPFRGGVVRCFTHRLPAALKTSSTAANPNRKFYCCSIPSSDPNHCSFFYWQDELPPELPQESQESVPQAAPPALAPSPLPHAATVKRNSASLGTTSSELDCLTPSQKRIKLIEASLTEQSAQNRNASPSSDMEKRPSPFPVTPLNRTRQHANRTHSIDVAVNYTPHSNANGGDITDEEWDLLTPPPTNPQKRKYSFQMESPTIDNGGIGTGAAYDMPLQDDSFRNSIKTSNQPITLSKPNLGESPPENPEELSAASIANMLYHLEGIPGYVRKLERRKIAAEKSNEAKLRKISRLEREIEELKVNQRDLEETISLMNADKKTI